LTLKQAVLRAAIVAAADLRSSPATGFPPFALAVRSLGNRLVPWAARTGFHDGVHHVNGIRMEIPRPPDWGGGGEFHMALGTYERHEVAYLLQRLGPGDTFVDVGAHVGYLSLPIARRVGPRGRVIAVEPFPSSVRLLRRNVALNAFEWVTVVEAAAAREDGRARLRLTAVSDMWGTLCDDTLGEETGSINVATRSLDSLARALDWPPVAGIKLDVEGAESDVLSGSEEVLARNPQAFLTFEVSGGSDERVEASLGTLRWLEDRGYRFRRIVRGGVGPRHGREAVVSLLRRPGWQDSLFNLVADRK
jgi:FkbM family methyltransferase